MQLKDLKPGDKFHFASDAGIPEEFEVLSDWDRAPESYRELGQDFWRVPLWNITEDEFAWDRDSALVVQTIPTPPPDVYVIEYDYTLVENKRVAKYLEAQVLDDWELVNIQTYHSNTWVLMMRSRKI